MVKKNGLKKYQNLWKQQITISPTPERAVDQPFLMPIEDVFTITGRGTVVTGRVERGIVKVGEEQKQLESNLQLKQLVQELKCLEKLLDQGQAGDNIGVLLRGTKKEEVERGQVLAKPGSIHPHTNFKGEVYVLTKEEGGRHNSILLRIQTTILLQNN